MSSSRIQYPILLSVALAFHISAGSSFTQTTVNEVSEHPQASAESEPLSPVSGLVFADGNNQLLKASESSSNTGFRQYGSEPHLYGSEAEIFGGAELLFVRPHFSEAIAFAQGSQTLSTFDTEGRELQFDYEASLRAFIGYRLDDEEFRFTYWHFRGDTPANAIAAPGQFFVDPFGNIVGAVGVIDPRDRRFGTTLIGGDSITTKAIVETDVYDLDYIDTMLRTDSQWVILWSAGVRIARIDQFYESVITNAGSFFSGGDFSADFIGAGPLIDLEARRHLGEEGRFSIFAKTHGALLVGEYDVDSSTTATTPAPFRATQRESLTRTIPVVDSEIGATWRVRDSVTISAGWLFQAWFDLGTSGGQFGGFFAGADDTNVMSFDGFSLRIELAL